jgi:hypothetical protein
MSRWTVLAGQAALERLESDPKLLVQEADYAYDLRHPERVVAAFPPEGDRVAFAGPSGWTVKLVIQQVAEGLPPWLERLTRRQRAGGPLLAFEVTTRVEPAAWEAGRPLDFIPERMSIHAEQVRVTPELEWLGARIRGGRAEVSALEIRQRTPPSWIEPATDPSSAAHELHRVLIARQFGLSQIRNLRSHRDRLVRALHKIGVANSEIAAAAAITPSRASQIAGEPGLVQLDARLLDGLIHTFYRRPKTRRVPRELSWLFAHREQGLTHAELYSLEADLTKILCQTAAAIEHWARRNARIDMAAGAAIEGARRARMSVADIARGLHVTTKTVRAIDRRRRGPIGRKTIAAVDSTLAELDRLDLVPAERQPSVADAHLRGVRRVSRSRERNLPPTLRRQPQKPPGTFRS